MVDRAKVLFARRAYEFRPDELRLTALIASNAHEQIRQYFGFQIMQVATPMQTFGPVPIEIPPGVVLDYGTTKTLEGAPAPIRFLHFEPQRIVMDVVAPSSAIDWTYEQLRLVLAELKTPDGSPVIGEPERIQDYSEISARFDFGLERLVSEPLRELARRTFGKNGEGERRVVPVSVKFRAVSPSAEIHPAQIGAAGLSRGQMIEVRAGTHLEDKTYFSATELPTDQHLTWLEALNQQLGQT